MRSSAVIVGVLIAATAARGEAQAGIKIPAGVAGTWEGKSMLGPKDSVATTWTLTAMADAKGWMLKLPNRDAVAARVIAAGGDSVVTESGPYQSVLRAGQQVTTRTTAHYKGDMSTGTFTATYGNGEVVKGKASATRKKM